MLIRGKERRSEWCKEYDMVERRTHVLFLNPEEKKSVARPWAAALTGRYGEMSF